MAIGENLFLTPPDIEQLRWTPELVFMNCGYLGKSREVRRLCFNELAASLGLQFYTMGVKAVIVAGWAVHDEASQVFAEAFYTNMLAGEMFGEAVRIARKGFGSSIQEANTWGAYQCYGDPGFRLLLKAARRHPANEATTIRQVNLLPISKIFPSKFGYHPSRQAKATSSLNKWTAELRLLPRIRRKARRVAGACRRGRRDWVCLGGDGRMGESDSALETAISSSEKQLFAARH